jgi:hypothetical protein
MQYNLNQIRKLLNRNMSAIDKNGSRNNMISFGNKFEKIDFGKINPQHVKIILKTLYATSGYKPYWFEK